MTEKNKLSIFSEKENSFYLKCRNGREKVLMPIAAAIANTGISASYITFAGLLLMVPFVYFFRFNPWFSLIFLLLSLLLDSIDGTVARLQKADSERGAFNDFIADYTVYMIVFLTMLFYGLLNPFWATFHTFNYLTMQMLVIYANYKEIEVFPVIRSKFLVYLFFVIWLITANNYFDGLLVFMTIYMIITNFFLYLKIKWVLL
jgi:phosphatidylglycerophosphate synthase